MFTVEATFCSLPVFNHQKNLSLLIKQLFSAMNSLWRLFSVNPMKTYALREVYEALQEPDLVLVRQEIQDGLPIIVQ